MAAVRSALVGLCRHRCGSSGCSAAASMVARGLGMRQGVGAAATRTPALPSLRPAAARNLECWRPFSTEGVEGACQNKQLKHKAESILRMLWQRSRDSVKNVTKDSTLVATSISFLTTCFLVRSTLTYCSSIDTKTKNVHFHHPNAFASSINASAISTDTRTEPGIRTNVYSDRRRQREARSTLPRAFILIPGIRSIYISSIHTAHDYCEDEE